MLCLTAWREAGTQKPSAMVGQSRRLVVAETRKSPAVIGGHKGKPPSEICVVNNRVNQSTARPG